MVNPALTFLVDLIESTFGGLTLLVIHAFSPVFKRGSLQSSKAALI